MSKRSVDVSQEAVQTLASKLDSFGEGLSEEECTLLSAVVAAGAKSLVPEVQGFAGSTVPMDQLSFNLASPGAPLRSVKPLSEISGLKFEVDVIEL